MRAEFERRNNQINQNQSAGKNVGARRRLKLWMVFMLVVLGFAAYRFIDQASQIKTYTLEYAQKKDTETQNIQSLNQMKRENERLKEPEYIEQIVKKKFGLYKPGEIPIYTPSSGGE
ncbi:cell division protein DivIC [Paenibacillus shirakamiensis]|uniref:Cell division protein DivIC n=1 Tax=Paenibacillus shirakamiensis TaxID=1265935 RepID=A0ABS4JLY8_9BACL|nr:septum formation initiator family protein [Paenibacillus shirakamiensis]MBP2002715.1 cell division protein DivIC [Paenibacillus shirakamiensis]